MGSGHPRTRDHLSRAEPVCFIAPTITPTSRPIGGLADITLLGNRIGRVSAPAQPSCGTDGSLLDARGLLVLPGMVDIHGDAFERQIQPRPETIFAHDIALTDTDRQLVANGITTACHGLTYSWEGGLRFMPRFGIYFVPPADSPSGTEEQEVSA